jgi:hypothetical protein
MRYNTVTKKQLSVIHDRSYSNLDPGGAEARTLYLFQKRLPIPHPDLPLIVHVISKTLWEDAIYSSLTPPR